MSTLSVCTNCGMTYYSGTGVHICTPYSPFIGSPLPVPILPAATPAPERLTIETVRRIVREEIERFHKK